MEDFELAWRVRRHAIEMTHLSGGGHIASILSIADIIAVLYADILNYDSSIPDWNKRDRVILSKGHAGAALYAALAEAGFFAVSELQTYGANGSRLFGHASHNVPGVDFSTGSLGHGLSVGAGIALAAQKDQEKYCIYVLLGDGECNEGSLWEAVLFANHFKLNNLIAIVDHNNMQSLDFCEKTMDISPFADKWKAFGWHVIEVDGHSFDDLKAAMISAGESENKPTVIIAYTIKGKGISFMENDVLWHYRYPHDGWEYDQAVLELYAVKPVDIIDPYTPGGIPHPVKPDENTTTGNEHTMSLTYHPNYR